MQLRFSVGGRHTPKNLAATKLQMCAWRPPVCGRPHGRAGQSEGISNTSGSGSAVRCRVFVFVAPSSLSLNALRLLLVHVSPRPLHRPDDDKRSGDALASVSTLFFTERGDEPVNRCRLVAKLRHFSADMSCSTDFAIPRKETLVAVGSGLPTRAHLPD